MWKQSCLIALALIATCSLTSRNAQAQGRVYVGPTFIGSPFFSANGPRPFSTRRGRELQAQRGYNRGYWMAPSSVFSRSSTSFRRSSSPVFRPRFRRF